MKVTPKNVVEALKFIQSRTSFTYGEFRRHLELDNLLAGEILNMFIHLEWIVPEGDGYRVTLPES